MIRNRIIFGAICLLLFVGLAASVSGIISLITGGEKKDATPTDTEKDIKAEVQQEDKIKADLPENRVESRDYGGQAAVIIGTGEMDGVFNPFFAQKEGDRTVCDYTQLKLIVQNERGEWVAGVEEPCLAYDYSVSSPAGADAVVYEFILKQGLFWSDGTPIDLTDVLFNLYVYLDPAYDGEGMRGAPDIVGLESYRKQDANGIIQEIEGIRTGTRVCDDKVEREVVQVVLNQYDINDIASFGIAIAPRQEFVDESDMKEGSIHGVPFADAGFMASVKEKKILSAGAGPYLLASEKERGELSGQTADGILLTANTGYCLSAPKKGSLIIKTVDEKDRIAAVKNGEIDFAAKEVTQDNLEEFRAALDGNVSYGTYGQPVIGYLGINAAEIPDINVRKALASVMDRNLIAEAYPEEMARLISCPADRDSFVYTDMEICPYDETGAKAVEYLKNSGYEMGGDGVMGKDGVPLSFYFSIEAELENSPAGAMLDNAKQILEAIGCDVTISVRDNLVDEVLAGERSCFFLTRTVEAEPDFYQLYYTGDGNKGGLLASVGLDYLREYGSEEEQTALKKINTMIQESLSETDYEKRREIIGSVYKKTAELAVELPLYQPVICYLYDSAVWKSLSVTAYAGLEYSIWNLE